MRTLVLALYLVLASLPAWATETVLTLTPRPGVTLRVLTDRPAPRVDIVTLDGGGPRGPTADACGASHNHGFYGMDDQAVGAAVQWLATVMRRPER